MKLLVDASNVLMGGSHLLPGASARVGVRGLCRVLDHFCRGRVVVVADGSPKPDDRPDIDIGRVELIWSGPHQKADPVILELIDEEPDPRNLRLISTDRQLQVAARHRGASSMDSEQFMRELGAVIRGAHRPTAGRTEKPDVADAAMWMRAFGLQSGNPPDEPDERQINDEVTRYMKEFGLEPED